MKVEFHWSTLGAAIAFTIVVVLLYHLLTRHN